MARIAMLENEDRSNILFESGPYLLLMTEAIRLARVDLDNPRYSESAVEFLDGELVGLFSEVVGHDGGYLGNR